MSKIDYDWVRAQLHAGKVRRGPGEAVLVLLRTWEGLDVPEHYIEETLDIFTKLAQSHALIEETEAVWQDCIPGQTKVGDTVRVKADAFEGDAGVVHNGRVGRVVAVRSGDVIVRTTDDRKPELDGAHYSPWKLEKRVR